MRRKAWLKAEACETLTVQRQAPNSYHARLATLGTPQHRELMCTTHRNACGLTVTVFCNSPLPTGRTPLFALHVRTP